MQIVSYYHNQRNDFLDDAIIAAWEVQKKSEHRLTNDIKMQFYPDLNFRTIHFMTLK